MTLVQVGWWSPTSGICDCPVYERSPHAASLPVFIDKEETMPDELRRRLRLDLELDADSLDDLTAALRQIAYDVDRDGTTVGRRVAGGVSTGYVLNLSCDESVTAESYRAALAERAAR